MKIVHLERNSVGEDVSVDIFSTLGEVTSYTDIGNVAERVKDANIIISNKAPLNAETLKNASELKLIALMSTGFDCVDIKYCQERGIRVANVAGYSTATVMQHTFAMALHLLEHLPWYDEYVKGGEYQNQSSFSVFDYTFSELEGKTWGIVGMGQIGKSVAKTAEAFGCKVIFYSASGKSSCTDYERVEFDELLSRSDILSLHCPLSDRTRYLIDSAALKKMKKSAVLINVARGAVVNGEDLYNALEAGEIAAAGLDVLEQEPAAADNPLLKIKNSNKLLITPHIGWGSIEARTRIVGEVAKNIEAFKKGECRNSVNGI